MNITTYENTVKKGTIKAHGRSDGLREMSEQLSEMQKIVTAPMSVDTPEQDGDKAPETAAADQVVGRAKSTAGAVKDAVTSEIKRAVRKSKNNPVERGVQPSSKNSPWRPTSRAGNTVQASYKAASKTAYRSTSEAVSHAARAGAQAAQQAAKTATVETVKATATVTAGAATAGTSVAVQAATETAKKVTVGTVQKIQESAQTATAVHAHDMARAAQQHVANKTKDVPATDAKGLPKILMAIWIGMVVLLLVFSNSFGSLASSAGRAINLNDRVESYRASITYWAQKDGIPEYVEVLLALCMAETGILDDPGDPFACSESGLAVKQPNGITDPEYSIEIGVYCFSLKVKKTGCKSPADKNNLFKALQAYNMGDGFIDFCNTYYGGVWSVECARAYSEKMGGGSTYGNPNYIEQFLRCYTFGTISGTYPGSLNSRGLCAPLEPGWEQNITQHFGGMYSGSPHKGMDIGMPEGTPVYAAADGKVTVANASDSWGYSWGYYVKINHAEGVDTLYAHLSSVAVSYGQYVHQGDVIGYVGSTGNSSGNHLHFELYLENNRVDPYPYIGTDLLSKYLERTF